MIARDGFALEFGALVTEQFGRRAIEITDAPVRSDDERRFRKRLEQHEIAARPTTPLTANDRVVSTRAGRRQHVQLGLLILHLVQNRLIGADRHAGRFEQRLRAFGDEPGADQRRHHQVLQRVDLARRQIARDSERVRLLHALGEVLRVDA